MDTPRCDKSKRHASEIQKRPAIYDVNCEEYNDRNAKMDAWEEMCRVMVTNWNNLNNEERNAEEKNLRGKWRNIRDYFMKELKLQRSQKSGPAARKRKKYIYFDQLYFLLPTVENKNFRDSVQITKSSPQHQDSDSEMDNPVIEEYDFPPIQPSTSRNYNNVAMNLHESNMRGRYSNQICEAPLNSFDNDVHDMLSPHSQPMIHEEDYDRMFLLSLLPMMKQVPDVKKLDVRIQMQQIIASALYASESK
ncbi:uncharacterized protein LOC105684590 isoform X2 [Athalia rosae]|uniref:uncharacterized protein LOC105684590 isoform X2 n=1 Tax=Athalia rosae TaxID=37344 RepID=UPI002033AEBC|nr:uncharacterized protein LOC105684590 isoform X2 [Athalia rosae]